MAPKLHIVIASTRPGRVGPKIAKWFFDYAKSHGKFEPVLVDLADFNLPVFDEPRHPRLGQYEHAHTKAWSESVKAGDAFVFVTPEYNYFPAPSLVNALSFLSKEWNYKAAGFVSYGGVSGGLRGVEATKPLLSALKVVALPEAVPVPAFPQFISDEGVFTPNELMSAGAATMLDELLRWTDALAPLRQG